MNFHFRFLWWNLPVPTESCAAVLVEPIVPDEGRAIAPIAVDKLRQADTRADVFAAAAAIAARKLAWPRDPRSESDTPTVRKQNSEGLRSQRDRARNILYNDWKISVARLFSQD